jgi:hypothetical protein
MDYFDEDCKRFTEEIRAIPKIKTRRKQQHDIEECSRQRFPDDPKSASFYARSLRRAVPSRKTLMDKLKKDKEENIEKKRIEYQEKIYEAWKKVFEEEKLIKDLRSAKSVKDLDKISYKVEYREKYFNERLYTLEKNINDSVSKGFNSDEIGKVIDRALRVWSKYYICRVSKCSRGCCGYTNINYIRYYPPSYIM